MKCEEYEILINNKIDGEISDAEDSKLSEHLENCKSCTTEAEGLIKISGMSESLPVNFLSPYQKEKLWKSINNSISKPSVQPGLNGNSYHKKNEIERFPVFRYSIAAVLVIAVILTSFLIFSPGTSSSSAYMVLPYWKITSLSGSPVILNKKNSGKAFSGIDSFSTGEFLTTDVNSKAEIKVASIGALILEPSSKLRMIKSSETEYRVELQYGTLNAHIYSTPKTFFVETRSTIAVDMGCAYTITVDTSGDGIIYVHSGMVVLTSSNRESLVPAGKFCMTKKDSGPGTPYSKYSSAAFRNALVSFDFNNGGAAALKDILRIATQKDAATLICLMPRVDDNTRMTIYNRVNAYSPAPASMSNDSMLKPEALNDWLQNLEENINESIENSMQLFDKHLREHMEKDMEKLQRDMEELNNNLEVPKTPMPDSKSYKKFKHFEFPDITNEIQIHLDSLRFDKKQIIAEIDKAMEEVRQEIENNKMQLDFDKEQLNLELKKVNEEIKEEMKKLKEEMKKERKKRKESVKPIPPEDEEDEVKPDEPEKY